MKYAIICTCHTRHSDTAITLWGPNHAGYAWDISKAGRYSEEDAAKLNRGGREDFAVPFALVESLAVECHSLQFERPTVCVLNARDIWKELRAARLPGGPSFRPEPRRYAVDLYDPEARWKGKLYTYEIEAESRGQAYRDAWRNGMTPDEPAKIGSITIRRLEPHYLGGEDWLRRHRKMTAQAVA